MLIVCNAVLLFCIALTAWTHIWVSQSTIVPGQVVELVKRGNGEDGTRLYAPKVAYELDGERYEFTSGWASNRPEFSVGQSLRVVVKQAGERQAIASLMTLYGIPIAISLITLTIAAFTLVFQHGDTILHFLHPQLL